MSERTLTTAVQTETEKTVVRPAIFAELLFDAGPVRIWSGVGNFTLFGNVFTGAGQLVAISEVEESAGDVRATGIAMTLSGLPSTLVPENFTALCLAEQFQGRKATLWLAFFDAAWAVIPDPIQIFKGKMDYPMLEEGGDTVKITVFAESHLIDLERPRIRRYTDADQQQLYPGDTGLRFVAALQNKVVSWKS